MSEAEIFFAFAVAVVPSVVSAAQELLLQLLNTQQLAGRL